MRCLGVGTVGVVLAAGRGKRLRSRLPKVLHRVGGVPMVLLVVEALRRVPVERITVVVGAGEEQVRSVLGEAVAYARQEQPLGTGHALLQALPFLEGADRALVVSGDVPLVPAELLQGLLAAAEATGAAAVLATAVVEDPTGYGRVVRDAAGGVARIVEEADADPTERAIREINAGLYCFAVGPLRDALRGLAADNAQGEYYLVDVVPALLARGLGVAAVTAAEPELVLGVNTRAELARAEANLRRLVCERWSERGVTFVDPATAYVSPLAELGPDTTVGPFTVIAGRTVCGSGCELGPGGYVRDSRLGDGVRVFFSVVEESELGDGVTVGPFSHLRSGNRLEEGVRVGNFAELKNSRVGAGTKVPHHSYLGDADVGRGVNVGAGTVTVNYDGLRKHRTVIADGAFIGCNANLIAPVTVGEHGWVGAGSTVDEDVPPWSLALARARQSNKPGWVRRRLALSGRDRGEPRPAPDEDGPGRPEG